MSKFFKDRQFWKTAIKLAVPVAFQNLLTSSYSLADTLLVSNLGTAALSSVGMIGQWTFLMNMILVGFCSATSVFASQFWGIKDTKRIKHICGISMILALLVSLSFTVVSLAVPHLVIEIFNKDETVLALGTEYLKVVSFSYIAVAITNILASVLRAVENVKLPMYASAFTTVLNIFLDYCMIFGKFGFSKMGVRGAALATSISAWVGVVMIVVISVIQRNIIIGKPSEFFRFSKNEMVSYLRKAAPVVLNEGMWGGGTFVYNVIFANMGYEYFSAVTILRSFENIALVMFFGIGSAASVMIGKSIGSGQIDRAITDSKRFSVIVPSLAVVMSVFIVIFRQNLVGIFNMGSNISELTLKTAVTLMIIYAVAFPLRMIPYIQIVAIFRSGGDTVTGAKFEIFCLWALSVPATLIAVYAFKVPFVVAFAIMYIFEDIPKNIFSIYHFLSNKWIKPVTKEGIDGYEKYKREIAGDEG